MPCFTDSVSKDRQILIDVAVADAVADDDALAPEDVEVDLRALPHVQALLDTGANSCYISADLAVRLNLREISEAIVTTASERTLAKVYQVRFFIPMQMKKTTQKGELLALVATTNKIEVRELPKISPEFDVIIGMDIIAPGSLHVSGDRFTFCL